MSSAMDTSDAMEIDQTDLKLTKLPYFCAELRQHILSYSGDIERFNYAQCARSCHDDIQEFKKIVPWYVKIQDYKLYGMTGLEIKMNFKDQESIVRFTDVGGNKCYRYERNRLFPGDWDMEVLDGNPIDEGHKYLKNTLRFLKYGRIKEFEIDLEKWNDDIFNFQAVQNVEKFVIHIDEAIYPSFINTMNQLDKIDPTFIILPKAKKDSKDPDFVMPPNYETSKFFKQHGKKTLTLPYQDVYAARFLFLLDTFPLHSRFYTDDISEYEIIRVLQKWIRMPEPIDFEIHVPVAHKRKYDITMFRNALPNFMAEYGAKCDVENYLGCRGKRLEFEVSEKFVMCRQL